ncbi:MAG TPA: toast rack family protein [Bryobacteraceae bacterium]|nr:toast rack family protein [Bryobacteraceae bacterium]
MHATALLGVPLALCLAGCVVDTQTGPLQHDTFSVPRDKSEFLRVNLEMGAGDLRVSPGAAGFADGDFTYNIDSWRPLEQYNAAAAHGVLDIRQPEGHHDMSGNVKYEWNVRLADNIPLDLNMRFGAGDARLNIGSLFLRSVDVEMGVGHLDMDLRGMPRRDYEVRVRGGIGEATIHLPHDAGVYAKAQGGIGSVRSSGLRREGDHMVNDAYDHSKASVHLDIQGGIGQINLLAD